VEGAAQPGQHPRVGPSAIGRANEDVERPEAGLLLAKRLPDAALDAIAIDRMPSVLSRHEHSEPRQAGIARSQVKGETVEAASHAVAQQPLEIRFRAQPAAGVQTEGVVVRG
jgi:hypothetical protein